jgi:hypothetical protein
MVGVEYMNDDPAEVDVLYGKVYVKDGAHVLQEVADGVVDHFCSKGLCLRLDLHVSLYILCNPAECLLKSVYPYLCLSVWNNSRISAWIFMIFHIGGVNQNISTY